MICMFIDFSTKIFIIGYNIYLSEFIIFWACLGKSYDVIIERKRTFLGTPLFIFFHQSFFPYFLLKYFQPNLTVLQAVVII
jgi:hypothetical protein